MTETLVGLLLVAMLAAPPLALLAHAVHTDGDAAAADEAGPEAHP